MCPADDIEKTDYVAGTADHISISMHHLDDDSSNPVVSSADDDDSKMSDKDVIPIEEDDNEEQFHFVLCRGCYQPVRQPYLYLDGA